MTHDEQLLKALRDLARVEQADSAASPAPTPESDDPALIDRMTEVAMRELNGTQAPVSLVPQASHGRARSLATRRWTRRIGWVLPAAAAAAVLLLWRAPAPEPIAAYRVEVALGAERATRSIGDGATQGATAESPAPAPASLTFRAGMPFELVLRPATQTAGPLAVKAYLDELSQLTALPVHSEISKLGLIRLQGRLPQALDLDAVRAFLLVVVARPDEMPAIDALSARERAQPNPAWQTFRIEIRAPLP